MKASDSGDTPRPFLEMLESLRRASVSPSLRLTEVPGPGRLAPFTAAISGHIDIPDADVEAAHGRFVVLYDPDGQPAWQSTCRIVIMVRAEVEPDICADPMIHEVAWSWLTDALLSHGRIPIALAGTVTRTLSNSFGELQQDEESAVELRASWSVRDPHIDLDLESWDALMAHVAGLPPLPEGVTPLRARG